MSRRYTPHSIALDGATTDYAVPAETISAANGETLLPDGAGAFYDLSLAIARIEPVFSYGTKSVPEVLKKIGSDGACLAPASPLISVVGYEEVLVDCKNGAVAVDGHRTTRIDTGLVTPRQLQAAAGGDALLRFQVDALTDTAGNEPFEIGDAALPPSINLGQYTLGAIRVGGVVLGDTSNVDLDFGIQIGEKTPALGSVYPETVHAKKAQPAMTITGRDLSRIGTGAIPQIGKPAVHADTELWFRKRLNLSTFVPDGTAAHWKVTMSGLAIPQSTGDGSGESESQTTYLVRGVWDGSNSPLVFTFDIPYAPGF